MRCPPSDGLPLVLLSAGLLLREDRSVHVFRCECLELWTEPGLRQLAVAALGACAFQFSLGVIKALGVERNAPGCGTSVSQCHAELRIELLAAFPEPGDFALARVKDRFKGGGMTDRGRNLLVLRRTAFHGVDVAKSVVQRRA